MKKSRQKVILILALAITLLAAAAYIGRYYVLSRIKTKLEAQLYALRDSGYIVRYDSIAVDTRKNEVTVHRLSVKRGLDSALCASTDFFSAHFVKAQGFRLLPLILKNRLKFATIEIDSPRIVLYENFFSDTVSEKKERREFSISVDQVKLPNLNFSYHDSSACQPNTTYTSNAIIEDLILAFYKDRPAYYNISSVKGDNINIHLPSELYSISIRETTLNLAMGFFDLDTLRIIPQAGKIEFGRKMGKESDRIEGVIPYLNLYGLTVYREDSIAIKAKKMTTQLFLRIFRDKRLPFKNNYKPLPAELLNRLPFGLMIDSLIVNKSFVEYEEFVEEADSAGHVFFDDLYASILNIDNTKKHSDGKARLAASASFMGAGDLQVRSDIPWDPKKRNTLKGSLKNMDFRKLNTILEPQVKMRIESGHLNELNFNISYDNNTSAGDIELNYNDLKVVTFRTEEQIKKKNDRQKKKGNESNDDEKFLKAPLKSFVVNTFILKSNMDDGVSEEKRSGTISFERDKRKAIFNYWAKSLFSGIKSAYNIDRLEDSRLKSLVDKKDKE